MSRIIKQIETKLIKFCFDFNNKINQMKLKNRKLQRWIAIMDGLIYSS